MSPTPKALIPDFAHIVILIFENKEYGTIIGNKSLPNFNHYAQTYTLLNAHYAITHPSLPNYLALIGGDTFGITSNCNDCYLDAASLPDLIEASGRTWRTYQERMPSVCYLGDAFKYAQKHNPFIYFTPVRENSERCQNGIVPLTQLDSDLAAKTLPNFIFITPDLCNSAHDSQDCPPRIADAWLGTMVPKLQGYLDGDGQPYLIILTWDEGQGDHSCCGLPEKAGGRVATVLISPQAKPAFEDETPYTHYSILKTISAAWHLPYLGHAADAGNVLIIAPWQ
jgi:phospholipase C